MTNRFFPGSMSNNGKMSEATRLKRLEIEKGGKLPFSSTDRYKRIVKKKLQEHMEESQASGGATFQIPGAAPTERKRSRKTEEAMRMIAQRKAMKEEKELRAMVSVQPRILPTGRIDKDGKVYDLGNNLALTINKKNGNITTPGGMTVGKYNPKKMMRTNMLIRDRLQTSSPYALQQKKLLMAKYWEDQKLLGDQGNAWGGGSSASEQFMQKNYGGDGGGYGQSGGGVYGSAKQAAHNRSSNVGAWGAMSSNVLGTFSENVHGGMADNVWGGTDSNIWGGIGGSAWGSGGVWGGGRGGGGSIFGGSSLVNWNKRGLNMFGTGNGKNFLKSLGAIFAGVPLLNRIGRARSK